MLPQDAWYPLSAVQIRSPVYVGGPRTSTIEVENQIEGLENHADEISAGDSDFRPQELESRKRDTQEPIEIFHPSTNAKAHALFNKAG